MDGVVVHCPDEGYKVTPTKGSAGIRSHVAGATASVSNLASATGGIGKGNFIENDNKSLISKFFQPWTEKQ